ncbi:MAG: C1 family peptidase [Flavobacteriales bacterium]|nr:C1 family peptidase [Flavobacteriales bacterium]MBP6696909.1 C1 family peptidase [Flavobacteriales bacterium]
MAKKQLARERILNCMPSQGTEKDWTTLTADRVGALRARAALPKSKDLREPWWEVGDQGETGSCVGWACAEGVLRWHFVKAQRLANNRRLSTRFTWMAAKEIDEFTDAPTSFIDADGTSLKAALDVSRKYGAVLDSVLPFGRGRLYAGETEDFYAIASERKIMRYFNLGRDPSAWRRWIATNGPILARLDCDNTFMEAKETRGKLVRYRASDQLGGHAVCLVGYTPEHFIVRNSWGTTIWGDKGFAYASRAYAEAAFTETYGVEV